MRLEDWMYECSRRGVELNRDMPRSLDLIHIQMLLTRLRLMEEKRWKGLPRAF